MPQDCSVELSRMNLARFDTDPETVPGNQRSVRSCFHCRKKNSRVVAQIIHNKQTQLRWRHSQRPCDLLHKVITQGWRTGREVHAARLQLHDEQEKKRQQSTFRPDLKRRDVDRGQYVPVRFKVSWPGLDIEFNIDACLAHAHRRSRGGQNIPPSFDRTRGVRSNSGQHSQGAWN